MRYLWVFCLLVYPAWADEERETFVEANLLGIFFHHEFGHALIDVMALPLCGQEEVAADVASLLMIHALYDQDSAVDLAYGATLGFLAEDQASDASVYWDVHGPDAQRFYNTVCLFYGAYPEFRAGFSEDFDLPEERALPCPQEFALAQESWGGVFDDSAGVAEGLRFDAGGFEALTVDVIEAEVAALNADFVLPEPVTGSVVACDEANAFYDPQTREITMCIAFEDHWRSLFDRLDYLITSNCDAFGCCPR